MQKNSTIVAQVNKIKITFTKRQMTAYGGFTLIASFLEQIGFAQMIERAIPITECSPNGMGIYGKVAAYVAMIFAGAERFSHLIYLGNKEVLAKIFGVKRLPDAATTLTRMFNKLKSLKTAEVLSRNVWAYLVQLIPWKTIGEDWLTFDSSVLVRYGEQEGVKKGYNPAKHGRPSHSPLLAFLNRGKYVIHLWNRSGNVTSWNNILAFFDASYDRIRGHINVLGVIADSGFYLKQFIERLEDEHLTYIIAARLIRPLQRKIYSLTNWQRITTGLAVSEFSFMHPPWGRERRYIVVRQNITRRKKAMGKTLPLFANDDDIRDYRFSTWITNSREEPYNVWTLCKPRANDENTIKELKEDFALGGFSMKKFYAVEAAMVLRVLVYNLFVLFRYEFLGKKEKRQHLKTLRYKYFVLPAQMGKDGREAVLRISTGSRKVRSKISYLFARIGSYIPLIDLNCTAVGYT
ncbi:MAG: IS1380 family transposase [Deltaproteobacteria bacterium]|nr:IS1380 family transposase [Deltaproteobacteria bacterium]